MAGASGERELTYEQLTHFKDSAVSPALSPDGQMIAFLRSDNWFLTRDQIYIKLLPYGEPVLAHPEILLLNPSRAPGLNPHRAAKVDIRRTIYDSVGRRYIRHPFEALIHRCFLT